VRVFIVSRTSAAAGFEVLQWDQQSKTATLRGSHGTYRSLNFDPATMKGGWRLTNEEPEYLKETMPCASG